MGLDRIFAESVRELPEGEKKCFLVIPPDSRCIKIKASDATRISHIELGGAKIVLSNCPTEDEYSVINLVSNARFGNFVLSDEYIASCNKKKCIVGKRKTEDGSSEFEDRVEVDASVDDVSSKNSDTFTGETFVTTVVAYMPTIIITPKD